MQSSARLYIRLVHTTNSTTALCERLKLNTPNLSRCNPSRSRKSRRRWISTSITEAAKALFSSYKPEAAFQTDILINNAVVSLNQHLNDAYQGPIEITDLSWRRGSAGDGGIGCGEVGSIGEGGDEESQGRRLRVRLQRRLICFARLRLGRRLEV